MTEAEEYVWWNKEDWLNVANVVDANGRTWLIHHVFPDPGGRGHQLSHECHCDPCLVEVGSYGEVWRHVKLDRP